MDGPWQIGHRSAAQYGNLAAQTGRAMRLLDPELTLIACGSSGPDMPTFGAWEATVLQETYDVVDLISAHAYFHEEDGDLASFLACPVRLDEFIDGIVSTVDHVKATLRKSKQINISFDEWNVWYEQSEPMRAPRRGLAGWASPVRAALQRRRRRRRRWPAHRPDASLRPSGLREPRPAGQRDRTHHDRAKWGSVATDDLLPVRPSGCVGSRLRPPQQIGCTCRRDCKVGGGSCRRRGSHT